MQKHKLKRNGIMSLAIIYGSTTGNTEEAAMMIRDGLGVLVQQCLDVAAITPEDILPYDVLILGCPTWHIGELQDDWEDFLPQLKGMDLHGKKIALFGMGDAYSYPDNFLDALGIIWEDLQKCGNPELIGTWPTQGYSYNASRGLHDQDNFLGLGLDEENQSDLHEIRIKKWTKQLRLELGYDV